MDSREAAQEVQANVNNRRFSLEIDWKQYTTLAGLVILIIISAVMSPTFLSPRNIINIATQISAPGVLAIGATFVILTAGIDLSVGSLVALTGVVIALTAPIVGWALAIVLTLIAGILIGCFHGLLITRFKVPPFITTLAGLSGYKGIALVITGGVALPLNNKVFDYLGSGKINSTVSLALLIITTVLIIFNYLISTKNSDIAEKIKGSIISLISIVCMTFFGYYIYLVGGLPIQVFIFILLFVIAWFVLKKTVFGREVYAIGGNSEAARLAGVKVKKGLITVYAIGGFLAAIAGTMVATRLGSGTPQVGELAELDAITAVVIGGTSLMGGAGSIGGTIIGVILIGVLNNLLSLLNVTADMQMIFKGAIILWAVILDTKLSKK